MRENSRDCLTTANTSSDTGTGCRPAAALIREMSLSGRQVVISRSSRVISEKAASIAPSISLSSRRPSEYTWICTAVPMAVPLRVTMCSSAKAAVLPASKSSQGSKQMRRTVVRTGRKLAGIRRRRNGPDCPLHLLGGTLRMKSLGEGFWPS